MATFPTAPAPQPPPNLPTIQGQPAQLTNYLQTFALWCRGMFQSKLDANVALPAIILLSPGGLAFRLTVDDAGALTSTQVPLGGGKP
jgi:hypothetical protein